VGKKSSLTRSAAHIQRGSPWLSLDAAQLQAALAHAGPLPPAFTPLTLEGSPAPPHHAHVSLEGPQAAARRRPRVSTHHLSIEGPPLRSALERRYQLEGKAHDLIRRARIGAALVSTTRRK
jgi:hypothetical protein